MKNNTSDNYPTKEQAKNSFGDGNLPLSDNGKNISGPVEPLPESTRPRKDGPGGD